MARQNNEHLTTGQLSAYLDNQLTPQEQALVVAHLRTCEHCQATLVDLRQMVAMLHALPQVEVPRSFVLPAAITPVPARPAPQETRVIPLSSRQRTWQHALRRSARFVSTLAAVLGLLLILSGLLAGLSFHGGSATSMAPVVRPATLSNQETQSHAAQDTTPNVARTPVQATGPGGATATAKQSPTPVPTPTTKPSTGTSPPPGQTQNLPPVLDLGTTAGRLSIGAALLVLSSISLILTRRSSRIGGS